MKASNTFLTLGEAMVELAPVEGSLYKRGFAGDTLNTAWYLRAYLADAWNVGYVTALGDDPLSGEMTAFIHDHGIDTTSIRYVSGKTCGLYLIALHDGERSFSYWRDSSAARQLAEDPDWLKAVLKKADKLFLSGISIAILSPQDRGTLMGILQDFLSQGGEISFDPNFRPKLWENRKTSREWLEKFAGLSATVLPSFDDERDLFGDASPAETCIRYRDLGIREVVVKNSSQPVTYCRSDNIHVMPISDVARPKDSTGAGDSFNGAYLASVALGHSQEQAIKNAISLSAKVINTEGALMPMSEVCSADMLAQ